MLQYQVPRVPKNVSWCSGDDGVSILNIFLAQSGKNTKEHVRKFDRMNDCSRVVMRSHDRRSTGLEALRWVHSQRRDVQQDCLKKLGIIYILLIGKHFQKLSSWLFPEFAQKSVYSALTVTMLVCGSISSCFCFKLCWSTDLWLG